MEAEMNHDLKMNVKRTLIATVAGTMIAGAVFAADFYIDSLSIMDGVASITVDATPNGLDKGWFTGPMNTFTRTKVDTQVTLDLAATSCSGAQNLSRSSMTDGTFTPHWNASHRQVIGYTWNTTVDLTSYANHWYNHTLCDGSVEVVGCDQDITVTLNVEAVQTSNDTLLQTFLTQMATLDAIQDPDVIETGCDVVDTESGDSCGIGQCVQACEHSCDDAFPGEDNRHARRDCKGACVCDCKQQLPDSCPPHHECD
jgi:hypothetical protein